jgi:hypothetical protein
VIEKSVRCGVARLMLKVKVKVEVNVKSSARLTPRLQGKGTHETRFEKKRKPLLKLF